MFTLADAIARESTAPRAHVDPSSAHLRLIAEGRARRSVVGNGRASKKARTSTDNDDGPIIVHDDEAPLFGVLLAQMSLRQGLRQFGKRAEKGAMKETQQLHDMETFFPRHAGSLTKEERVRALASLIFLKEKRTGEI